LDPGRQPGNLAGSLILPIREQHRDQHNNNHDHFGFLITTLTTTLSSANDTLSALSRLGSTPFEIKIDPIRDRNHHSGVLINSSLKKPYFSSKTRKF
jgi:hypothetical protein